MTGFKQRRLLKLQREALQKVVQYINSRADLFDTYHNLSVYSVKNTNDKFFEFVIRTFGTDNAIYFVEYIVEFKRWRVTHYRFDLVQTKCFKNEF